MLALHALVVIIAVLHPTSVVQGREIVIVTLIVNLVLSVDITIVLEVLLTAQMIAVSMFRNVSYSIMIIV